MTMFHLDGSAKEPVEYERYGILIFINLSACLLLDSTSALKTNTEQDSRDMPQTSLSVARFAGYAV